MNRNVGCLRVCCVAFEYLLSTRNSSNVHNSVRREFYALAIYYLCACLSLLHPKILLNVGVFRLLSPSRCSTCSVFYDSPSTSSRVDVYVRYSTNNRNKNSPQSLHSQAKRHTILWYGTVVVRTLCSSLRFMYTLYYLTTHSLPIPTPHATHSVSQSHHHVNTPAHSLCRHIYLLITYTGFHFIECFDGYSISHRAFRNVKPKSEKFIQTEANNQQQRSGQKNLADSTTDGRKTFDRIYTVV